MIPARPGSVASASGAVWTRLTVPAAVPCPARSSSRPCGWWSTAHRTWRSPPCTPLPPATSPSAVRAWTGDLAALPDPEPGVLRVLAGDFNATFDHAAFRAVLRRGYVDAARAVGGALAWTWRPLRLRFPRLALDHVLVDPRITVAAVRVRRRSPAATTGPSSPTWCCRPADSAMFTDDPGWARLTRRAPGEQRRR